MLTVLYWILSILIAFVLVMSGVIYFIKLDMHSKENYRENWIDDESDEVHEEEL